MRLSVKALAFAARPALSLRWKEGGGISQAWRERTALCGPCHANSETRVMKSAGI